MAHDDQAAALFENDCPRHGTVPFEDVKQNQCLQCFTTALAEAKAAGRVETFKECLEEFGRLEGRMESMRSSWPLSDYQSWLERNAQATQGEEG